MTHESGCHFFSLKFIRDLSLSPKKALLIIDLSKTEDEYRIQTSEGLAALTRIKYLHNFFFSLPEIILLETLYEGSIYRTKRKRGFGSTREKLKDQIQQAKSPSYEQKI